MNITKKETWKWLNLYKKRFEKDTDRINANSKWFEYTSKIAVFWHLELITNEEYEKLFDESFQKLTEFESA